MFGKIVDAKCLKLRISIDIPKQIKEFDVVRAK